MRIGRYGKKKLAIWKNFRPCVGMTREITKEAIRAWRRSRGLTQAEFGALLGWSENTVAKIETGRRRISGTELLFLERVFSEEEAGSWRVCFNGEEVARIIRLAQREGFYDVSEWICAKIRAYLAMRSAEGKGVEEDVC